MTTSLGNLMLETMQKRQRALYEEAAESAELLLWFAPPTPAGYVPPPPGPPPPYVPSDRARQLLRKLRAAQRQGKRGKQLLIIIDALIDEVTEATAESYY